jgi:putative flippase GtrA
VIEKVLNPVSPVGEHARIARFLAVGVFNTVVGLAAIYLCKGLLGTGDVVSNVVGYAVGLANSFAWNRRWTFGHSGAVLPAAARFVIVFLIAYLLNLATVMAAIHMYAVNSYVAQAIGIAPYTAFFYLGSRWFAFRG